MIERLPKRRRYRVTDTGLRVALFLPRLWARTLRPGLATVMPDAVPNDSALRRAFERLEKAMDDWDDVKVRRTLQRLHRILNPVRTELPFQRPAAVAEARVELFAELREALRLRVKPEPGALLSSDEQAAELRDIKAAVEALTASLRERRPERGPAQNMREAIDLILDHLTRHGPSLWGHAISLPGSVGGGVRLIDRTTLLLEGFFHRFKHAERRRSGRAILTQDLEQLPAAAVLACPPQQEQAPAERQAQPDQPGSVPDHHTGPDDTEPDIVSSSMPIADREIIRAETMETRLARAVASRPPRWQAAR